MPKCAVCYDLFPPQFMIDINEENKKCIFCEKDVKSVEIGDTYKKYTKEDCKRDYLALLNELKSRVSGKEEIKEFMERG